jgi:hypothetical protein
MAGGSAGGQTALTSRRLTPEPISSSLGTARLPPSIFSLTNFRDLDTAAANVRFASRADIHAEKVMSALPPKEDIESMSAKGQ